MHGKDLSDLDLPNLTLYPSSTNFVEHKQCFKLCVKDFNIPYLSPEEEMCSSNVVV